MMNIGNPESCFSSSILPNEGVGLVRIEFIISNHIKINTIIEDIPILPITQIKNPIAMISSIL